MSLQTVTLNSKVVSHAQIFHVKLWIELVSDRIFAQEKIFSIQDYLQYEIENNSDRHYIPDFVAKIKNYLNSVVLKNMLRHEDCEINLTLSIGDLTPKLILDMLHLDLIFTVCKLNEERTKLMTIDIAIERETVNRK